jgi:hypothetical protein
MLFWVNLNGGFILTGVEQYLAFAETMALQQTPMYMNDWIARLDVIIQLNGRALLTHAGRISHQMALDKSIQEYDKYRDVQKQIQHEVSMNELEQDIQQLQKSANRHIKDGTGKIFVG